MRIIAQSDDKAVSKPERYRYDAHHDIKDYKFKIYIVESLSSCKPQYKEDICRTQ